MKNNILYGLLLSTISLFGCKNGENTAKTLLFATSGEYPPFEYMEQGKLKGYDIEVAQMIAQILGKEAQFENMQFSSILPALAYGHVDAAISTITITQDRQKIFDFSQPYYFESMSAVFRKKTPIQNTEMLFQKKIACQLGTTMEIWLKKQNLKEKIITTDNNTQAIEALKAGHIDAVVMDGAQAKIFSEKNPGLSYTTIAKSEDGFGIALKKHSTLTADINYALEILSTNGQLEKLQTKWLGDTTK
ncbi:ABC transporter substrate-binding protein [Candidatus Berkiella cookevillensis]|uniref:ABC transporter substrate-binding protein n=1 Tax=Candidatus Berkiella cookevillensis TaxID=437022 RepID=A0A0Q9YCM1_9GAMM|nr:ABC transporter substrate-binding protein [Candidatus Berkiella cookevillensis]MCS5708096.1 ABC transporter substrate-binding protein [Candidatus Berkiella cookevillensis]